MAEASVVIRVDAKDAQKQLQGINAQTQKLSNTFKDSNGRLRDANGRFVKLGAGAKGASGGVSLLGKAFNMALGPIGAALTAVTSLTAAFKVLAAQDFAEAKVESLGVNSEELVKRLKNVSAELNGAASVAELTAASYDVASAGFNNAADAAEVLKAASLGATGGFSDINTVGNAATSVLNAYGIEAAKATEIVDKFIQTQNDGKIVVAEYAQNIGKVASAAAGLGIDLDEINAVIAQSTAAGVQAEVAFTGLKGALARLASGEAANALKGIGIDIDAATLANDGLLGTFKKLQAAGLDTGQIFKALGTEAGPALLPVLNNLEKFEELLGNQKKSAGAAAKAQRKAADTIYGAWKRVTTVIENLFADQEGLGVLIKTTLNLVAELFSQIALRAKLVLAPFNAFMRVVGFVSKRVEELGLAFRTAFQESEGAQKLQMVFAALQEVLGRVQQFFTSQFQPVFEAALGIAAKLGAALGEGLYQALDLIIGSIVQLAELIPGLGDKAAALRNGWNEIKTAVADTAGEALKIKEATDQTAVAKQKLLEQGNQLLAQASQMKARLKEQEASFQNQRSVATARLQAETAITQLAGQQLQRAYDQATTVQQRLQIAKAIYQNQVQLAALERQAAQANIQAEFQALGLKRQGAEIALKEIEAKGLIAQANAKNYAEGQRIAEQTRRAVEAQRQAVGLIDGQIQAQRQVAKFQAQAADAQFKAKELTARTALEQKLVSDKIGMSQREATRLAEKTAQTATGSERTGTAMRQVQITTGSASQQMVGLAQNANAAALAIERAAAAQIRLNIAKASGGGGGGKKGGPPKKAAKGAYWAGGFQAFARGGVVNRPTLGLIGEGGESEYIIPSSKAGGFAMNYLSGKRGSAAIPKFAEGGFVGSAAPSVSIQTGPVTQMGGMDYVTTQDLGDAVSAGVEQTLDILRRDGSIRSSLGLV